MEGPHLSAATESWISAEVVRRDWLTALLSEGPSEGRVEFGDTLARRAFGAAAGENHD